MSEAHSLATFGGAGGIVLFLETCLLKAHIPEHCSTAASSGSKLLSQLTAQNVSCPPGAYVQILAARVLK